MKNQDQKIWLGISGSGLYDYQEILSILERSAFASPQNRFATPSVQLLEKVGIGAEIAASIIYQLARHKIISGATVVQIGLEYSEEHSLDDRAFAALGSDSLAEIFFHPSTRISLDKTVAREAKNNIRRLILDHEKSVKKSRIDPPLPPGIKWEQVEIKFLNGEEIRIIAGNRVVQSSATIMGWVDGRTKNQLPDANWNLLRRTAELAHDNGLSDALMIPINHERLSRERMKQLSDVLQFYFGINDKPFRAGQGGKKYCKFNLVPESGSETGKVSDIEQFHKQQTPSVFDPGEL